MADLAGLGFAMDTKPIKDAAESLRALTTTASAAERAAEKFGVTAESVSKRAQRMVTNLEFQRVQMTRSAADQEKYNALRRAGVTEESAAGRAISASVAALQAQRAAQQAQQQAAERARSATVASTVGFTALTRTLGPLAIAYGAVQIAQKAWESGMKAGDLGEQADQVNVSTDALQAYRFQAAQNGVEVEQLDQGLIRLTATMGQANNGSKDAIELFNKLGVNILDAEGELRATSDVLPELARGLLKVGSETQRNSMLVELFGRSGARMVTMLQDWAKGNDELIDSARRQGGVLDSESIAAWDRVGDAMKRAAAQSEVTYAKLGAPIAAAGLEMLERLLRNINDLMEKIGSKKGFWASILEESQASGRIGSGPNALRLETADEKRVRRLNELAKERDQQDDPGRRAMVQADIDRINRGEAMKAFTTNTPAFSVNPLGLPAGVLNAPPSVGARNPTPKASGSDPYAKAIEGAREYILTKQAETAALGQNAREAARLKHEQELLNKAANDNTVMSAAQVAQLKELAGAMADADAKFAGAKFMDDANKKAQEFVASQQLERETLFMTQEAALAYRYEQEWLNAAKQQGIDLTQAEIDKLRELAGQMASQKVATDQLKDAMDFGKQVFKGFFSDLREGLMNGKSLWESFGNAAMNVLNRIAEKLLEFAATKIWEAAFPGGGGGGAGGGLGGILASIFGGGAGAGATAFAGSGGGFFAGGASFGSSLGGSLSLGFANGGAFSAGKVIPFASGGVVSRPTLFPMASGAGLMGEAGPEAIMPLRRGRDGRLGVAAGGGGQRPVIVQVMGDADWVRVTAQGEAVKVVRDAAPAIEKNAVKKAGDQVPSRMAKFEKESAGGWQRGAA